MKNFNRKLRRALIYTTIVGVLIALIYPTAAAAQPCEKSEIARATTPAGAQDPAYAAVFQRQLASATRIRSHLLVIGDSLAAGIPDQFMTPIQVVNFGIGGDSTQHVLYRMMAPELTRLKPLKVLIIVGTNNLSHGGAPCAIIAGITQIVLKAKELWPAAQIAFLEIPPRGPAFKVVNNERISINTAVRSIPDLKSINADAEITCGWRDPCVNYLPDYLHFTPAGYMTLTKIIKAALF